MKITVQSIHFNADKGLLEFIQKKVDKLETFYDNIINGEVECNKGDNMFSMNDRIGFYQYFLKKLGVNDANCACSCAAMKPY